MKTYLAERYMRVNRIVGTITCLSENGFEYMLPSGACYYVPYCLCENKRFER